MALGFLKILGFDLLFVAIVIAAVMLFGQMKVAAFAVMKRNFISYFSNPTGYAFLCLFVLLTSLAAFCTPEFFNANLANFDQLSRFMPAILLLFIPSVTMSIWAEERRQGTDELLLTLPATDFDIVSGKYLAAAAVFTASLVFSQFCNAAVLTLLSGGDLDTGTVLTTYLGYWLMGLAMLAIGMIASFFTSNLTVGFILGLLFNAPLVMLSESGNLISRRSTAEMFSNWSLLKQAEDFGRGTLSLSSITYFVLLTVLGVYLSMVLIGRRHWSGGKDGESLLGHYVLRALALIGIVIGANSLFANLGIRADATENKVNSLSADTIALIDKLKADHPVNIDCYLGSQIPEDYTKTRLDLLSKLKEIEARARGKVRVRIYDELEPFSKGAQQAEERYGIKPQNVRTRSQGVYKDEQLILGAAFTCGLQKVVVPFFDYGVPVEYELIRSINTVAKGEKKKLGVVRTDAQFMGGFEFSMGGPSNTAKQQIIDELEKQYTVEDVSPQSAIEAGKYDVLLIVQPSSLTPQELTNVVDVVKKGQPTAIFEDPLPAFINCPGTGQPKRQNPMMSMFGGGQPPPQKGNMNDLWKVIGVKPEGEDRGPGDFQARIVWQDFNPYKKVQVLDPEFVVTRSDMPQAQEPINQQDAVTQGIEEILFPFPGAISQDKDVDDLTFTPLVQTSTRAGSLQFSDWEMNRGNPNRMVEKRGLPVGKYTLAARIQGKTKEKKADSKDEKDGEKKEDGQADTSDKPINVIYVTDIDLMTSQFVRLRAQPEQDIRFWFENITFVLNVIDSLANDTGYLTVRTRKPHFGTLRAIEAYVDQARSEESAAVKKLNDEFKEAVEKAQKESDERLKQLKDAVKDMLDRQQKGERLDYGKLKELQLRANMSDDVAKRELEAERDKKRREADTEIQVIRRNKDQQINGVKSLYKTLAVIIPPIPPLLIGFIVWILRRLGEREGVSKERLV